MPPWTIILSYIGLGTMILRELFRFMVCLIKSIKEQKEKSILAKPVREHNIHNSKIINFR